MTNNDRFSTFWRLWQVTRRLSDVTSRDTDVIRWRHGFGQPISAEIQLQRWRHRFRSFLLLVDDSDDITNATVVQFWHFKEFLSANCTQPPPPFSFSPNAWCCIWSWKSCFFWHKVNICYCTNPPGTAHFVHYTPKNPDVVVTLKNSRNRLQPIRYAERRTFGD